MRSKPPARTPREIPSAQPRSAALRVAYLSNQFPSAVEPYVMDEIRELRERGVEVIPCSARRCAEEASEALHSFENETVYLQPIRPIALVNALFLCIRNAGLLADFFIRVLFHGDEPFSRRARALMHTLLGAYYAVLLKDSRPDHIHVHHGYFSSWIGMVAARLLGIDFSMTLHGSDLLIHRAYLDVKLEHCKFCLTVSDFNKRQIFANYPDVKFSKVSVQRLGVPPPTDITSEAGSTDTSLVMLAVGRLHSVKNHSFLIRACYAMKQRHIRFVCMIAGEGPERPALERQIRDMGLGKELFLLGHLSRHGLEVCYAQANLVVLTSHSEGIPIVLMEAMAHGRTVLAPSITGIPELIEDGKTGFLYRPGSLEHFVERIQFIHGVLPTLGTSRSAAQKYVLEHFNHGKNLHAFGQLFIEQVLGSNRPSNYENPILQQI